MNLPLEIPAKQTLLILLLTLLLPSFLLGSKLVDVRPVDESILMVKFSDGEVYFRDDATGITAHDGFRFVPGDDQLIPFGEELDTREASRTKNWKLVSLTDSNYSGSGQGPVEVFRKSKVNHATHDWQYKKDHWLYLRLPHPLKPGMQYTLQVAPKTESLLPEFRFTYSMEESVSDAIHVNLVGYTVDSSVKSADLYLWLGDGGPRDYTRFENNQAWLYNVISGHHTPVGKVQFWKKSAKESENRNLTGSSVWTVDFSDFKQPGRYRLIIDGIGCSNMFDIRQDVWRHPYKTSVRGYYYMRIGEPHDGSVWPLPRQPRFIDSVDPVDMKIYMTDLDPYDPEWKLYDGDSFDEPHFKPATESIFWKHRLPGNPTNPNAWGGHSDALDWDRKLPHVVDAYDLLLPYLITEGIPKEDNLDIRESGNGIPDLIDEARNQVDFHLRLRVGEAYAHGLTNPSDDRVAMFQAGVTNIAAWANAANCAMLAHAFRISGHQHLMDYYTKEAVKAYSFASKQKDLQLDDHEEIGHAVMRGRDFRMMAAAYLYNVTGDTVWEDRMAEDSVVRDGVALIEKIEEWSQIWGTAAYIFTPHSQNYPELVRNMAASVRKQAIDNHVRYMDERPSRRSSYPHYWQTAENVQLVMMAHAIEKDPAMKDRMLKSMILEADWGLGRNPSNLIEMTGMGPLSVQNAYTSGRNDGSPGVHPGHTPYHNLNRWGNDDHPGNNPGWFTDKAYPDWEDGWPHQEGHFNSRYCWSNSEFCPRETMRGKMALYAYLHALNLNSCCPMQDCTSPECSKTNQVDASPVPPGGLAVEHVPQFILLTFDDNPEIEPMQWIIDEAKSRSNPDGSFIPLTFLTNGTYLDNSEDLGKLHLKAYEAGHQIANHTQNHPNGSEFSVEEWKADIQLCTETFKRIGLPMEAVKGFRTPFIDYNAATFEALEELGFVYDSSVEEGNQKEMDGTNYNWPYTLHNGSPGNAATVDSEGKDLIASHPDLWELAVHVLIVPPDEHCLAYDVEPGLRDRIHKTLLENHDWNWSPQSGMITGYDYNLLEMANLTGPEFLAVLKYSFDLRMKGNRAPMVFGGHTFLYPASMPDRRQALTDFMDYTLNHPAVRYVSPTQLIQWMHDPKAL